MFIRKTNASNRPKFAKMTRVNDPYCSCPAGKAQSWRALA
ncbi:hypothetical protein B4119_2635 [Parageobacillus caldoxylosilyticus]|uniref:Uncharacterized protein n=1 Tax=Saccharococcus caldoxylosilyticus TaxID=81408 RepID=A0A150LBS7_9BACL|nr:hypothetical protein B4119_2635 [Parageobacillus caldoxylosilyticus]